MTVSRQRWFGILAAVFCLLGLIGVTEGVPTTWMLLSLVAFMAAVMAAVFAQRSIVPAKVAPHVEAPR